MLKEKQTQECLCLCRHIFSLRCGSSLRGSSRTWCFVFMGLGVKSNAETNASLTASACWTRHLFRPPKVVWCDPPARPLSKCHGTTRTTNTSTQNLRGSSFRHSLHFHFCAQAISHLISYLLTRMKKINKTTQRTPRQARYHTLWAFSSFFCPRSTSAAPWRW